MDHIFCEGLSSCAACPPSGATAPATPPSATLAAVPVSATCTAEPCHQAEHFATRETLNLSTSGISVVDTDKIGSVLMNFVDQNPYSEYGSGSTQVKIGQIRYKRYKVEDKNSLFRDPTEF